MQKSVLGLSWLAVAAVAFACNTAQLSSAPPPTGGPDDTDAGDDGGPSTKPDGGRDPGGDQDAALIPASSSVTIQVQPSDSGAAVLDAIKAATKSVHMTMYLLTNYKVIGALITLHNAGKDVKVVLNQNFPDGSNGNTKAYDDLTNAGVPVSWAPPAYTFTHAKTVVIDGATALVMTMNLTQTSATSNREYIATDTDPADVAELESIFQGDFANSSVNVNGKLVVSPRNASPVDARARLKALIDSATQTLDIEGETLSDDVITDAIIAAKQAGVATRVVVDGTTTPTPAQQDSVTKLKANGVPIVKVVDPTIHAKAIVVDGARAYVGSMNFTATSLLQNREIGLVTDAAAEVAKVRATIAEDFAAGTAP